MEILLNSTKNINSVNKDGYEKIELSNKVQLMNEYDIRNVLSATDIFDAEREENSIYRIYGKIEYLSLLNGLKNNYITIQDFFLPTFTGNSKTLLNSFDFYLVKPVNHISTPNNYSNIRYVRQFEVIATPLDFDIYNAGFSSNLFGEQEFSFNFNKDFDVSQYLETYDIHSGDTIPTTELFLHPIYKVSGSETMKQYQWNNTDVPTLVPFTYTSLNIGNIITGDMVEYGRTDFYQATISGQSYQILTPILDSGVTETLHWKYDPFIPFRLRYFSDNLNAANSGNTSYELVSSIPSYATNLFDGNFVWRNILAQGIQDPMSNLGVDYPFVNGKRYLFSNIIFDISPDFTDAYTLDVFINIKLGIPLKIKNYPTGDLDNIGKPCQ